MAEPSKQSDRLTLIGAGTKLGMTEGQVRRLVLKGQLVGGQELGRWWYVSLESVDRYLAEQQTTAAS